MREMKDSGIEWIGEIPERWEPTRLKHICNITMGQSPSSEDYNVDGIGFPFLQGNADFTELYPIERIYCDNANKFSRPLDILFSVRAPVGAKNISDKVYAIGRGLCAITPNKVNNHLMWYQIDIVNQEFNSYAKGSTYDAVTIFDVNNSKVVCPPLPEQQSIADYLDRKCAMIDSIIEKQKAVIEKLKLYKQSVITEAVTKGLDKNAKMKPSGIEWISEIPISWEIMKFGRCATIKSNLVSPDNYSDLPQISPDSIEKSSGRIIDKKTVKESGVISWNHFFFKGQIIYSKIRPLLNKVTIAPYDGLCSADMYPIETENDTNFLLYTMLSDYFIAQVGLVTENRIKMPKINQSELNAIMVSIPPIEEQHAIVEFLDAKCIGIENAISRKEQIIEKLTAYKKSLIYECVTGKIEVEV